MDKTSNKNKREGEFVKLTRMERFAYGGGSLFQILVFGLIGGYLLFYMTAVNGLSAAAGATVFLIVRWINVIWDPLIGYLVDKRKITKRGKYKPMFITWGIPLAIFSAALFLPLHIARSSVVYACVSYLAAALIYSLVNIPYTTLQSCMTRDQDEISKLVSTNAQFQDLGYFIIYTCFPLFVQLLSPNPKLKDTGLFGLKLRLGDYSTYGSGHAWFIVYAIFLLVGLIGLFLAYFCVHERVLPSDKESQETKISVLWKEFKRNKPLRIIFLFFLSIQIWNSLSGTLWAFYMQYNIGHSEWMTAIGAIGVIPSVLLVPLWPKIRRLVGKKGFFYLFLGIFVIGQILVWCWAAFDKDSIVLGYIGVFFKEWGLTAATGYMWALVPEVVTYSEYTYGKRNAGVINSLMGLSLKIGVAIGSVLPGYINAFCHFNGNAAHQTATALSGISVTTVWLPVIAVIGSVVLIKMYPLSDDMVHDMNHGAPTND